MNRVSTFLGQCLGRYLTAPSRAGAIGHPTPISALRQSLIPGDVLLVEGDLRISQAIKYLTQSPWSHAAVFVGHDLAPMAANGEPRPFIEADIIEGVRACPYSEYARYPTRICRPFRLDERDRLSLLHYLKAQIGRHYDLRHVFDLARYLVPLPIPAQHRRRMIALGSGDPTKAFCSSLIAEAFARIRYPIVPLADYGQSAPPDTDRREALRINIDQQYNRYFSSIEHRPLADKQPKHIFPRDFDVSPYFQIIKPTLELGFNYHDIEWEKSHP